MTMRRMRNLLIAALAAAGTLAGAEAAQAANPLCGVSGTNVVSIGDYNPFSGSAINTVPVNLTLTRFANGSAKTQTVNFVLTQPPGSPAYQITYNGSNVLYTTPVPAGGQPEVNSQAAGQIHYSFGGASHPDTATLPVVVTIPAGVDLSAGDPIHFDILYVCKGTGQMDDVTTPAVLPNAITLTLNVLSALQANYAGPALDFGEIGEMAADVSAVPTADKQRSGYFGVKSSGPYEVSVVSQNGYRLTYPGGDLGMANQRVGYTLGFLGQSVYPGSAAFAARRCTRAGVTAGQSLAITTTLREGGTGKTPAPNYRDVISVTFTPLAVPVSGAAPTPCS